MCFVSVKDEEPAYRVPARRVERVRSVRRVRTPSPRRSARFSRTVVEERRTSPRESFAAPRPPPPPPPPAPPTVVAPAPPPSLPPPPASVRSRSRNSHYVEVAPSSSSSSSSSDEDVRSRTTRKSAKSKSHAPSQAGSEYHIREKEYRRSRGYSQPRQPEYETFRYVDAPPRERESYGGSQGGRDRSLSVHIKEGGGRGPRGGFQDDPRASRTSYGGGRRERERIEVDDGYGRRNREYRR